jgi:hypothetical protein
VQQSMSYNWGRRRNRLRKGKRGMNSFYQKSPYKSRVTYYNKHRRRTPDPRIYSKHQRCNGSKY